MRILLTNNHIAERAGSELVVTELAEGLQAKRPRRVALHAVPGQVRRGFRGAGAGFPSTHAAGGMGEGDRPDVIHVTHWPAVLYLRVLGITAPSIYAFLGPSPRSRTPRRSRPEGHRSLGASARRSPGTSSSISGWPGAADIAVVRNWIAPGFDRPPPIRSDGPREGGGGVQPLPPRLSDDAPDTECRDRLHTGGHRAAGQLDRDHAATPARVRCGHQPRTHRHPWRAWASPPSSSTPMAPTVGVTVENFRLSQRCNFSGRGLALQPDEEQVRRRLREPLELLRRPLRSPRSYAVSIPSVTSSIRSRPSSPGRRTATDPDLRSATATSSPSSRKASATGRSSPTPPASSCAAPPKSCATPASSCADTTEELNRTTEELNRTTEELNRTTEELNRTTEELNRIRDESDHTRSEVEATRAVGRERARRAGRGSAATLNELTSSTSWRITARPRAVRPIPATIRRTDRS